MGFDLAPGAATLLGAFSGANFFLGGEERWETCGSVVLKPKKCRFVSVCFKTFLSMVGLFGRRWGEAIFTTFSCVFFRFLVF